MIQPSACSPRSETGNPDICPYRPLASHGIWYMEHIRFLPPEPQQVVGESPEGAPPICLGKCSGTIAQISLKSDTKKFSPDTTGLKYRKSGPLVPNAKAAPQEWDRVDGANKED